MPSEATPSVGEGDEFPLAKVIIEVCAVIIVVLVIVTMKVVNDVSPDAASDGKMGCGVTVVVLVTVTCMVLDPVDGDSDDGITAGALGVTGEPETGMLGGVDPTD